jgi:hypothetical protein
MAQHEITLTDDEESFLQGILPTKFKTNGVVPTIDEVLQKFVESKIAKLKKETDRYTFAEKVKSKWDSLTDEEKTQIKSVVDKPMKEEML